MGRLKITSPWDIVRLDLDDSTDEYVEEELYKAPEFGGGVNPKYRQRRGRAARAGETWMH